MDRIYPTPGDMVLNYDLQGEVPMTFMMDFAHGTALSMLVASYATIEAYFKLPASHRDVQPQDGQNSDPVPSSPVLETPIAYKQTEPATFDLITLERLTTNCFIMETHVSGE